MVDGADHTAQYPVEYVKTRRQLPASKGLSSLEIIRATVAKDGLRGLYSGCSVLAASNAAKSGIRFLGFETARSSLPSLFPNLAGTSMLNVYSGLCAGVAESILVVTPGEAVKTRIVNAAATGQAKGSSARTIQVIAAMLRQNGVLAFWRGLSPVLCKQGTNSAVRFSPSAPSRTSSTSGTLQGPMQASPSSPSALVLVVVWSRCMPVCLSTISRPFCRRRQPAEAA